VHGVANHAGAAAMNERRDALAGTAKIIVELEAIALAESGAAVMTVGRINNHPNAVNVIPDRVEFTIDLRAGDAATIQRCDKTLRRRIDEICRERQLRFELEATETIAPVPMNAALCARLGKAVGEGLPTAVSGALHDAAVIAPHLPTVMLFVPSRDGISHNPAEFSRVEDLAAAANAVQRVIQQVSLKELNSGGSEQFMAVCGRFFEHSPWIAERAWKLRPFGSLADLQEKMCGVVKSAGGAEQLALIRAHPDLVGRLAREGRLTRESNGEQAAAGLADLSGEEVAAFEKYNAEYRAKFAFPFVICARENRKQAILAAFPNRLRNETAAEIATALTEIFKIARLRAADAIWED
jgi:OHCU decarboxylase